jgi:uncharacterized membrane protein YdjX (TVP38/TMEM64 family)
MIFVPREPMRTGGGGQFAEVLIALTTLAAASLSALAVSLRGREASAEANDEEKKAHQAAEPRDG